MATLSLRPNRLKVYPEESNELSNPQNDDDYGPIHEDTFKSASDALKTRICYVSQVVIFLVALVALTIGLTVGYNKKGAEQLVKEEEICEFSAIKGKVVEE